MVGGQMNNQKGKLSERVSDAVANFGGSWYFIFFAMIVIAAWVILNTLQLSNSIAWDKHPFILLNLILSLIAAFQAPFILMSQTRFEKKQDEAYRKLFAEQKELLQRVLELQTQSDQSCQNKTIQL